MWSVPISLQVRELKNHSFDFQVGKTSQCLHDIVGVARHTLEHPWLENKYNICSCVLLTI